MVERLLSMQEAQGSIPWSSTAFARITQLPLQWEEKESGHYGA
jgi:hypothetical protein